MKKGKSKKSKVEITPKCYAYIKVSFNNTIVTIANLFGQVITWSSAGKEGAKGHKKSTPFFAGLAARDAAYKAFKLGARKIIVRIQGLGGQREAAIRALAEPGLEITSIEDITPEPFNGCRAPNRRKQ